MSEATDAKVLNNDWRNDTTLWGVNPVFTLAGSEEIVTEEFDATADAVDESLPTSGRR